MDGITPSIAEMRRFPYMTGKNERLCPKPVRLNENDRVGFRSSAYTLWGYGIVSLNFHIPTDLVVAQGASAVESGSRLDFLLLHNLGTSFVAP